MGAKSGSLVSPDITMYIYIYSKGPYFGSLNNKGKGPH